MNHPTNKLMTVTGYVLLIAVVPVMYVLDLAYSDIDNLRAMAGSALVLAGITLIFVGKKYKSS